MSKTGAEINAEQLRAQLSAVTKERDELRAKVHRIATVIDDGLNRRVIHGEIYAELEQYRNLLLAALQPGDDA